jgi:hypothetical protein
MKVISVIEDEDVIGKVLKHLGLPKEGGPGGGDDQSSPFRA